MRFEVARFAQLVRAGADASADQQRSLEVLRAVEAIRADAEKLRAESGRAAR